MISSSMANKSKSINNTHLLIFFWFFASHAAATSILNQGNVLNLSASLVSENGLFTLRFGNVSSNVHSMNYYLGVWCQGAAYKPFWLANGDRPITDGSGALVIDETGKLLITYSGGAPLELYKGQSNMTKVAAILLNNGNFVVKEANAGGVGEQILWQSFDHPTDSFLPGMKLGINLRTGQKWSLTSWLANSLPTPGAFTLDWDPIERQLIAKLRGVVFWKSGVLENNKFENIKLDSGLADHKFIEVSNEDEKYITYEFVRNQYTPKNWINVTWLLLNHDGAMADQSSSIGVFHPDDCYGSSTHLGCKSLVGPPCRRAAVFLKKVVVIDNSTVYSHVNNASLSLSECKNICWKNCGCFGTKSYNSDGTGCVFFDKPLTETTNGKEEVDIIFSFPAGGKEWIWVVTAVAAMILMGIILVIVFLFFMRWRRARLEERFLLELMNEAKELEIEGKKNSKLTRYSFSSIKDSTRCFSDENKLGEGGYGPVYKGLFDGQETAIKRLSRSSKQGLVEFKNELIIAAKLQHTSLVRLLGFCIQGEEKMLVYEYMPNNSLDSYIFDQNKRKLFDWNKYFSIIEEIAQGLLYLHKYSRVRKIHRDLKISNILLDKNINPKISDFGMTKIATTNQSQANTNRIVGTRGYMFPEYALMGVFSIKSDVFSFGVIMLEIVSSRRSNNNYKSDRPLNPIEYAWMLWKDEAALELMHPTLRDSCAEDQVLRCINVALLCVEDNPLDRPFMADVITMFTSEGVKLPMPKQPAFCIEKSVGDNSSSGGMAKNHSINNLTISVITGR